MSGTPRPVWDRGDAIDADMLAFTIGDDWSHDRRLVPHDIRGSLAHVAGLARVGLIDAAAHAAIRDGLTELLRGFEVGAWTLEPTDEDVHSAVERRLTELVGEPGERMHTGRSRNEQVAVDVRLWLRDAAVALDAQVAALCRAGEELARAKGELPLPAIPGMAAAAGPSRVLIARRKTMTRPPDGIIRTSLSL
jgi:argininosuccinate lyase